MTRILLVEDEMLVREVVLGDLEDAGFEVVAAGDGESALEILQDDHAFDLLFTDIRMPGTVDGHALARQARALIPGLKVVYASGLADAGPDTGGESAEERYLTKPYQVDSMLSAIGDLGLGPSARGQS